MRSSIIFLFVFSFSFSLSAQEHSTNTSDSGKTRHKKNALGIFAGNTVIYQSNLHLPTVGMEYLREIVIKRKNPDKKPIQFGLGVTSEVEIGYHIVENKGDVDEKSVYDRESAFLILPTVFYRVYKGLIVYGGYGVEFEKNHNLGLMKLGLEYQLEMKRPGFYILPSLSWDHTDQFDGIVYGMVFAFSF